MKVDTNARNLLRSSRVFVRSVQKGPEAEKMRSARFLHTKIDEQRKAQVELGEWKQGLKKDVDRVMEDRIEEMQKESRRIQESDLSEAPKREASKRRSTERQPLLDQLREEKSHCSRELLQI